MFESEPVAEMDENKNFCHKILVLLLNACYSVEMSKISATIITFNEEKNIRRCLESLDFVDEIIVIDSFSVDKTIDICKEFNVKIYFNKFENFGNQKNFAESKSQGPWILNIDADEVVSRELRQEILDISELLEFSQSGQSGQSAESGGLPDMFLLKRRNFFFHKAVKYGGTYPDYNARLYKKGSARWTEPEVHEILLLNDVNGKTAKLKNDLLHYTCNSIEEYIETSVRYSELSVKKIIKNRQASFIELKLVYKPIVKFLELYILKRGFLDGYIGFFLAVSSMFSVFFRMQMLYQYKILSKIDSQKDNTRHSTKDNKV
ncbi:MAG: glycosyltransferase family 2 protein [Oligoflexia bacterium]|nr:glycosyltransferase family 2 protein [Oligoflexia bacterium]